MAEPADKPPAREDRFPFLHYLPLGLVIVLAVIFLATGSHRYFTLESLVEHRAFVKGFVSSRPVATVGIFILTYAALITLSIPAAAFMSIASGLLFGWKLGGALAATGASLGAVSVFLIARSSLGEPILRRSGPKVQKIAENFRADSFSYLLFLRLMPIVPFWVTNLAAALFGMRFRTFLAATVIGAVPVCYAFAVAGSGMDDAIAAHERRLADCLAAARSACQMEFEPGSLLTPQLMVALGALGLLALGPILARRWQVGRKELDE